jgi:hypothetical protein
MTNRQLTAQEFENLTRPLLAEVKESLHILAARDANVLKGMIHEEHEE